MKRLIIALHGYGSNGADLVFLGNWFRALYPLDEVIFISPNAPFRTHHFDGYQWFSIDIMEEEYITNAITNVYPIVEQLVLENAQKYDVPIENIMLCGFSQGAALAIHTGLRLPHKLHSIVSFSGGMANYNNIIKTDVINSSRIFLVHGNQDNILPHFYSLQAYRTLRKNNIPVVIEIINGMKHTIDNAALEALGVHLTTM